MNYKDFAEKHGITVSDLLSVDWTGYETTRSFQIGQTRKDPNPVTFRSITFRYVLNTEDLLEKALATETINFQNANRHKKEDGGDHGKGRARVVKLMSETSVIEVKPVGVKVAKEINIESLAKKLSREELLRLIELSGLNLEAENDFDDDEEPEEEEEETEE